MKLANLASIQTGVFTQTVSEGNSFYIQVRDFDEYGQLNIRKSCDLLMTDKLKKHQLKDGTILFVNKGLKYPGYIYRNTIGPSIASSSFLVIRIEETSNHVILPEFLVWFLNHPQTQIVLRSKAMGSSVPAISLDTIAELEIPLPNIKTQQAIIKFASLRLREREILSEIDSLKEKHIQKQLLAISNR